MIRTTETDDRPPHAAFPGDIERYRQRMASTFGYPDFRGEQARVLEWLASSDVLAIMPTGSGKSLCYVLPALEVGRTLVVSPLIALMQDQVEALQAAGVPASFINSNLSRDEQNARYLAFVRGETALLYVAPERFANERFVAGLQRAGVNLLAVDEAHCISEWGHDFRPDYLSLGPVRERLGRPRTLALTATADERVRRDIVQRLGIAEDGRVVVSPIDRPNLTLNVVRADDEEERKAWLRRYVRGHEGESGIVYAGTRRTAEELSEMLRRQGVRAETYHAGLDRERRSSVQRRFTTGQTPVIVATNAFGMGIDKPDVRYVVHYHLPGRLEAYYQEAGRAGRDGDPAECTLLYAARDRTRQQRFIDQAHPDDEVVHAAWRRWVEEDRAALDEEMGFDLAGLGRTVAPDADAEGFAAILGALRASGLVSEMGMRLQSRDADAPIDTSAIDERRRQATARLGEMVEYAETSGCRRAVILRYFGEQPPERCDGCDNCLGTHEGGAPEYPSDLYDEILALRDRIARRAGREAHTVFELRTARELATYRPRDESGLLSIWGIAQTRADWFGAEVLRVIAAWEEDHTHAAPPPSMPVAASKARRPAQPALDDVPVDDPEFGRAYRLLREWRGERSRRDGVPAYTLFSDRTLRELAATRPDSLDALANVWGLGRSRVERFGQELLDVISGREA
ncbi:MAG: ATP-dependent DNA helicase RecQ [Dehalococcoidia bacterium]